MGTIQHARTVALQATSPRIVAVALPTNVTVDLSNTSPALNNLPSYSRVMGITALATQSTLANGGGYLTGFGSVSSQNSLAFGGAYLTGFGAVASRMPASVPHQPRLHVVHAFAARTAGGGATGMHGQIWTYVMPISFRHLHTATSSSSSWRNGDAIWILGRSGEQRDGIAVQLPC